MSIQAVDIILLSCIDGSYTLGLQVPEITNYTMVNRTYRYFEGVPLFPFGYGLYVIPIYRVFCAWMVQEFDLFPVLIPTLSTLI